MSPTPPRIPDERVARTLRRAIRGGLLTPSDTAAIFYDLSHLAQRVVDLVESFPPSTLHAIAIKANPLAKVLHRLARQGIGFEAASYPELCLAERTGVPATRIVFDSPAKTEAELRHALALGCHVNADSLPELDRLSRLIDEEGLPTTSTIGVRVNPQVGTGTIASTSVAGTYSKFGVALAEHREALLERVTRYRWLTGLHLHIGSQGCSLAMLLEGIGRVLDLANEADARLASLPTPRRITTFDLGGGLPVAYHPDQEPVSIQHYAQEIERRFGELCSGRFRLITEFGRYVHANAGWVASRVEYVKRDRGTKTAILHVGADLLLRKCYRPSDWHHELMVLDPEGNPKQGLDDTPYMIAGPLCFAGDMIAERVTLPVIDEGDVLVIRDTGAYTLGMWSRYNSRQIPKVLGYTGDRFEVLRERESVDRVLDFWS